MSSEEVNARKKKSEDGTNEESLPRGWEKRLSRNSSMFL